LPPEIKNCDADIFDNTLKECVFGEQGKSIVLIGDSHASQWFPAVRSFAQDEGMRLITMFKSSCNPSEIVYIHPRMGRRFYECEQWRAKALARINQLHPNLIIMTGVLRIGNSEDGSEVTPSEWNEGLSFSLSKLNESGAHIIYLRDNPHPGFNVLECLAQKEWQKNWRGVSNCTFQKDAGLNEEVKNAEMIIAGKNNADYLDMNEYICPGEKCEPEIDGVSIYRDSHHLSNEFVINLSTKFKDKVKDILK